MQQWISHFIVVDRIIKDDPAMLNGQSPLQMAFSVLKAICETIAASESLVPFQDEYTRLASELKGGSSPSATEYIDQDVISRMLLGTVNSNLAVLGSVDEAPKVRLPA